MDISSLSFFVLYILSLKALVTTQKLDRLIAAAANMGFKPQPNVGYNTPAASGIPITL